MVMEQLDDDAFVRTGAIKRHRPEDFEGMRQAGQLAAACLDMLTEHVTPGVETARLVWSVILASLISAGLLCVRFLIVSRRAI